METAAGREKRPLWELTFGEIKKESKGIRSPQTHIFVVAHAYANATHKS